MIWNGTENEQKDFFKDINTVHNSIKFEPDYSIDGINFLETYLYKDKNYNLQTKLNCKPTNRTCFLRHNSEHPSPTKKNIIYSQALRIKRICSEKFELDNSYSILKSKLMNNRGFKEDVRNCNIEKASCITRKMKNVKTTQIHRLW